MSRSRRPPPQHAGIANRTELKQATREARRMIDRALVRRALNGEDVPTRTPNAECEDRWCHD